MGECSAYSSLQADSKVKFAAWPTSWRPPGADRLLLRGHKVNSRIWLCAVADSTINMVFCIIIIIIIIISITHIIVSIKSHLKTHHRLQFPTVTWHYHLWMNYVSTSLWCLIRVILLLFLSLLKKVIIVACWVITSKLNCHKKTTENWTKLDKIPTPIRSDIEQYRFSWTVSTFGARWTVKAFRAVTRHLHLQKNQDQIPFPQLRADLLAIALQNTTWWYFSYTKSVYVQK